MDRKLSERLNKITLVSEAPDEVEIGYDKEGNVIWERMTYRNLVREEVARELVVENARRRTAAGKRKEEGQ